MWRIFGVIIPIQVAIVLAFYSWLLLLIIIAVTIATYLLIKHFCEKASKDMPKGFLANYVPYRYEPLKTLQTLSPAAAVNNESETRSTGRRKIEPAEEESDEEETQDVETLPVVEERPALNLGFLASTWLNDMSTTSLLNKKAGNSKEFDLFDEPEGTLPRYHEVWDYICETNFLNDFELQGKIIEKDGEYIGIHFTVYKRED